MSSSDSNKDPDTNTNPSTAATDVVVVPAVASAAAPSNTNDYTIAQALHCHEQLTETYGFPSSIASLAMDTIGRPDVMECCHFILENELAEDGGGPIVPISDCPHTAHHVCIPTMELSPPSLWEECTHHISAGEEERLMSSGKCHPHTKGKSLPGVTGSGSSSCPRGQNWICLECNAVRCSRYVNGHGQLHWEWSKQNPSQRGKDGAGHCIAMSMQDLSIWCYACQAYLHNESLLPYLKRMEELKFGKEGKDGDDQDDDGGDGDGEEKGEMDGGGETKEKGEGRDGCTNVENLEEYKVDNNA